MKENTLDTGVMFGNYHTKRDYGLYLTTRPDTGSPKPKLYSQDIPGADGSLDLTEATTGEVKYSNRTITVKAKRIIDMSEQEALKSQILGDLHGKKLKVILDEDPERYYYGRVTVTFPKKTHDQLYVNFTVDAAPYKLAINETEVEHNLESIATEVDVPVSVFNTGKISYTEFVIPAGDPSGDFSDYIKLAVTLPESIFAAGLSQFQVSSGSSAEGNYHLFNRDITQAEITARRVYVSISDLTAAGVDVSDIRRVLLSGVGGQTEEARARCRLCGTAIWGFFPIYNGQMSVVPTIYCPVSNVVVLRYKGKSYPLQEGWNVYDDFLIGGGESQVNVVSGGNTTIAIKYRMGWL